MRSASTRLNTRIAAIEAAILEQLQADADLAQRFAILTSVPAATTASAVLIEIPEFGTLDTGQAASLAGFALRSGREAKID
jgi:transposase